MAKNLRIRKALMDADMTQRELGELMGMRDPDISRILKYELAKSEQDAIIKIIKSADTPQEGA
jgi:predicted XRE-type DNA-binding protein